MKLALVIFDNMTALDFIGLYDPLTRLKSMGFLPELRWEICAFTETVSDDRGLKFMSTKYRLQATTGWWCRVAMRRRSCSTMQPSWLGSTRRELVH